ncbi:MAG TPA: LPS export ABC transporter permease LptG [Candidatus Aquicultoraceae bacterium]|nr:LPS export ABC transporter permease LptG [Candidatus Aquicultoraceae bacterium]
MTVVTRYLLREFSKVAAAAVTGFLILFLVIDFAERVDEFLKFKASMGEMLRYYLYSLPNFFVLTSPVAVLLAVLVTVSLRARANEFTAIFAGGISFWRACAPILAGCAVLSVLSLGVSETLAPHSNRKAREIARVRVRPGRIEAQFSLNRYWIRGEKGILSAQVIDPGRRELLGFLYLEVDGRFRLVRRVDARSAAVLAGGKWILRDGTERAFVGTPRVSTFVEKEYAFPETLPMFLEGETPPDEMTYVRLSRYIRDSVARGYDMQRYEVDLHAKLAYPLLNAVISLVAIPFALRSHRSGGVWRSIGTGLLIGFACWMLLSASLALGKKGLIPPLLSAWFPDLAIAAVGGYLFRGARR